MKNRVKTYYVTTHSPVHVSSGNPLVKGLDYFPANGRTWIIDRNKLEAELVKNEKALFDFSEGSALEIQEIAAKHSLNLRNIIKTSYEGMATADEMYEFIRDGRGKPYLPGSSIKGALRTALLWSIYTKIDPETKTGLLSDVLFSRDERFASQPILEASLNLDSYKRRKLSSNHNLMRVFHVADAYFNENDVEFSDVRVFNLSNETNGGWKNFPENKNEKDYQKATQLATEILRIGAYASLDFQFDDFLLESDYANKDANFSGYRDTINTLPELCNQYARYQIDLQRMFAKKYQINELLSYYSDLKHLLENLPSGDFLLRMGWGSGWQGMTGNLYEDETELESIRKKFDLGKITRTCPKCGSKKLKRDFKRKDQFFCRGCKNLIIETEVSTDIFPVFPKTRKVARYFGDYYPLGWLVFSQNEPDAIEAEDRSQFSVPQIKLTAEGSSTTSQDLKEIQNKFKKETGKKNINKGEKARAEVLEIAKNTVKVRLLNKDEGRQLSFKAIYLPKINTGDQVIVEVLKTDPEGNSITEIKFKSVIM